MKGPLKSLISRVSGSEAEQSGFDLAIDERLMQSETRGVSAGKVKVQATGGA